MIRHAAHGDLLGLLLAAVPRCERQVKLMGSKLGIVGKHFIKIAQTEKQHGIRILLLDPQILLHHLMLRHRQQITVRRQQPGKYGNVHRL